jgi:hypothetical protein
MPPKARPLPDHDDTSKPTPLSPEEFIRRRPEVSPEQGAAAGPGAPENSEPVKGEPRIIPPRP